MSVKPIFNPTTGQLDFINQTGLTSVTVSSPLTGTGTAIDPIVIPQSGMLADGYLSALNFERFDKKTSGRLLYYFKYATSDVSGMKVLSDTPDIGAAYWSVGGLGNGTTAFQFVTDPDIPSLTYIPSGIYNFKFVGSSNAGAGVKDLQICAEIWEVDMYGGEVQLLATTNYTDIIPATEVYWDLQWILSNGVKFLSNSHSRIKAKLIANVSGSGSAPGCSILTGTFDASYIALPKNCGITSVLTSSPISGTGLVGDPITIPYFDVDDTQIRAFNANNNFFLSSSGHLEVNHIEPNLSVQQFFTVDKDAGMHLAFITAGGTQNNTWMNLTPTTFELNFLGSDGTSAYQYLYATKDGVFQTRKAQADGMGGNDQFYLDNTSLYYNNQLTNGDGSNDVARIFTVGQNEFTYNVHKYPVSGGSWGQYTPFTVNSIGELALTSLLSYNSGDSWNNMTALNWSFANGFVAGMQVLQANGTTNNATIFQADNVGSIYNQLMVPDSGYYYNVDGMKNDNNNGFSLGYGIHYGTGSVMAQTRLALNTSGQLTVNGLAYDYSGYPQSAYTFILGQYGGLTMATANYDGSSVVYWNDVFQQTQQGALYLYGIDQSAGGYPTRLSTLTVDYTGAFQHGGSYYSPNQGQVFTSSLFSGSKYGAFDFYGNPQTSIQYDANSVTNQTAENTIVVSPPSNLVLNVVAGNLPATSYNVKVYAVRSFYGKQHNGALQGSVADLVYNTSYISGTQVLLSTGGFTVDWDASGDRDEGYVVVVDDGIDTYYNVRYNNSTVYVDDNTWTSWYAGSPTITNTSGATVPGAYSGDDIEYTVYAAYSTPAYSILLVQYTPTITSVNSITGGILVSWDWQSGVQYVIQKTVNGTSSSYYSCSVDENFKYDSGSDFPNSGVFPYASFQSSPFTEIAFYQNQLNFHIDPEGSAYGSSIDPAHATQQRWHLTTGVNWGGMSDVAMFVFDWTANHKTNACFGGAAYGLYPINNFGMTLTTGLINQASETLNRTRIAFGDSPYIFPSAGGDAVRHIRCDCTGGNCIAFPPIATESCRLITFTKIDNTANTLTITGASGDLINGSASYALTAQYETVTIEDLGAGEWVIVSKGI